MRATLLLFCLLPQLRSQQSPETQPAVPAAVRARLTDALTKTAATSDTAFELQWGQPPKKGARPGLAQILGARSRGEVRGSWHEDLAQLAFQNEQEDQLIMAGGKMIARDKQRDWCRRQDRFADGNPASSRPDPRALLAQLGSWPLAVTQRSAGSFEDRPVEVLSVTLTADQTAELLWSGALPAGLKHAAGAFGQAIQLNLVAGMGGGRQAATPPELTVDLAISLDPGTGTIFEVRGNAWAEQANNGNVFVFRAGAGAVQVDEDEEDDEEDEAAPEEAPGAPLRYEDGLPARDKKELARVPFRLTLRDHGRAEKPTLTPAQWLLLR